MEKLINELMKAGLPARALEIKVFGGGNVTDSQNAVGTENSEFVLRYLEAEGPRVRGAGSRRRIFRAASTTSPATGKVVRRLLGSTDATPIAHDESEY